MSTYVLTMSRRLPAVAKGTDKPASPDEAAEQLCSWLTRVGRQAG